MNHSYFIGHHFGYFALAEHIGLLDQIRICHVVDF